MSQQRIPRDSLIGLKNCGFTCYFNSVIQMLFDIPELRDEIFKTRVEDVKIPIQELQLLFGQLSGPEVDEIFRIDVKSTKTVDIRKMLDILKEWMSQCVLRVEQELNENTLEVKTKILTKFPEYPGETGTQEDAAEFLIQCILNKLSERILNSISLKHTYRIQYKNQIEIVNGVPTTISKENILTQNLESAPILNLNIIKHRREKNVNINTLINELFHLENKDPNSKINQVEHIIPQLMPNYLFFYWNRTNTVIKDSVQKMINKKEITKRNLKWARNFETIKVNTHLELDDRIIVEEIPYKLYSVIIHKGAGTNEGHYYYMFKENADTWIVFNDDRIYTISNTDFLREKEKNVVLVNYKKEELDVRREPVDDIRRLLPPVASAATAAAQASATAAAPVVVNRNKMNNKSEKIIGTLSFLKEKTIYSEKTKTGFRITDLIIKNDQLIGIKVKRNNIKFDMIYELDKFILPFDDLTVDEQLALMAYTDEENTFIYASKKELKVKAGGKRHTRKVDARKRKRTRKA